MQFSCVHAKLLQLCQTLCDLMDCSPPGLLCLWDSLDKNTGVGCSAILWGDLPDPRIEPVSLMSPALACGFFTTSATWEA